MACSSCVSLRPFPSTLLKKQGGYTVKSKEGEGSAAFGSRDEGDCASHVLSSRRHSSIGMCVSVVSCWVGVGSTPEANSGDPIPIRHARKHRTLSFPASMKKKNESVITHFHFYFTPTSNPPHPLPSPAQKSSLPPLPTPRACDLDARPQDSGIEASSLGALARRVRLHRHHAERTLPLLPLFLILGEHDRHDRGAKSKKRAQHGRTARRERERVV